jgi:DNA polymerase elongation subunit (family B)
LVASCIGWLLHVSIEQDKAILWIKTEDKKILRLTDSYQPFFYILSRNEYDGASLFHILSQQTIVKKVGWEENRSTNLFEEYSKRKLICVVSESVQSYSLLLKKLENDFRVKQVFNADLSHIQQYLFHKLKIEPTSKVEVEYNDGSKLVRLTKVEDQDITPPPFSILHINVQTSSGKINPEDSVVIIKSRYEDVRDPQQTVERIFDSKEEKDILEAFCSYVQDKDPDILVFPGDNYANTILDYLFARVVKLGLELELGREKMKIALLASFKHPRRYWIKGRLAISGKSVNRYSSVLDRFGFAGLIELCRFGFLTLDLATKYGMNRLIDSRNCYELIQRGYVISKRGSSSNNHEHIRTIEELVSNDRGGMIISPQTGLHEKVIVLDYDNEYANLIINHNLSYETAILNERIKNGERSKGLLPIVIEKFLKGRLYFQAKSNELPEESREYLWCQQRLGSLKDILVCLYGTTGSIWNRYGNVRVFEEINRLSREVLIKTKDVVQKLGYELIYADTDSVFIKNLKEITSTGQYEKLVNVLCRVTGLPISIEHNFKFLVLLPLEASEKIEALKQYYGVTHDGKLVVRGIEIRRHDTPKFIKEFQTELLSTLFDCKDVKEIIDKGYENALLLVTKAIDKIMLGGQDIIQDDLVVSKLLGQDIIKYRSLFPHVSAAIQLTNEDKHPSKGDTIKYIYTNSQHKDPLCRVASIDSISKKKEKPDYDKEKYKEMILDAAETVLGYFGFDRTLYGNKKNMSKRKWWWMEELRQERERDIKAEITEKHN